MSNLKWGFIAAAAALVISVLLGIIFDVRPLYIFLRALIFTAVFFGIGFSARMIINNFMPELLHLEEEPVIHENNQSGARVDITLGGEYAVPEMYKDSGDPDELGNIEELVSGAFKPRASPELPSEQFRKSPFTELEGIDGKIENDYNEAGDSWNTFEPEAPVFQPARPSVNIPPEKQVFTASFGDSTGLGGLADLDDMATAFSGGGGESRLPAAQAPAPSAAVLEPIDDQLFNEAAPIAKPVSKAGNKTQQLDGNFNPKELAQSIRTVLTKEK